MCNNQTKEYTNYHYEARIRNQRDFYIDKENMIQYVNELDGIKEQIIPEFDAKMCDALPDNSMLKADSELYYEWNFKKNDEMSLDIWEVSKGTKIKVWWICNDCGCNFDASITNMTAHKTGCPYCVGRKINHTNTLASLNPELASEWHPSKNGELTPFIITCGTRKKVWWLGECGHEWESSVVDRRNGSGCPYCSGNKVLVGFNDMWTTNPELASILLNPEDGYKYTRRSGRKVDWRCSCGNIIRNKAISHICASGLSCVTCGDGISYPEKFMFNLLTSFNLNFIAQATFDWSNKKRYDFYIPNLNTIIEVHGEQHYKESFIMQHQSSRTLEEERFNDKYKYNLAIQNGIQPEKYIVVDCSKSQYSFIKNSILNSMLSKILDLDKTDWNLINNMSTKSLVFTVCNEYNNGMDVTDLIKKYKISRPTILSYLKKGSEIGITNYSKFKRVFQLDMDGNFIQSFNTLTDASKQLNIPLSSISSVINGRSRFAHNYKWIYEKDYNETI